MPSKAQAAAPYVNRPEITEVFADSVKSVMFKSSVARVELAVTRFSPGKGADDPPIAERVTAARLVLTTQAMMELFSQMKNILDELEKRGAATKQPMPTQALQ